MDKNSGTRSGLLWQVERILEECKELGAMPKILLMENVPDLCGVKHINNFKKWRLKLEELGYSNYDALLNAKDFGIPQNRKRCFMVSILGNYNYKIPSTIPLDIRLKNVLEDEVDEKYYLSEKQLNQIICWKSYENPLDKVLGKNSVCPTITARGAGEHHRGTVQKGISQTITTAGGENIGVVVGEKLKKITENYIEWEQEGCFDIDCRAWFEDKIAPTVTTSQKIKVLLSNLRIRKLTPKECFRLMGLRSEDIANITKNQSDSSLYHLGGDSICTSVLCALFGNLFGIDYKIKIKELINDLTEGKR